MSSNILDQTARFSGYIHDYAKACSDAVDEAQTDWPVAARSPSGTVSTGFVNDNALRSIMWTQSFDVVDKDLAAKNNNENDILIYEDLLSCLEDIFSSKNMTRHAEKWDQTFMSASTVKCNNSNDRLVHWKFRASPLAHRDMLYLVHARREDKCTSGSVDNKSSHPEANHIADSSETKKIISQVTYAYASVNDDWVRQQSGMVHPGRDEEPRTGSRRFVRAFNCFPTCDRVTVYVKENGRKCVTIDHLMTTKVGGWVKPVCFNYLFKNALLKTNAHECEAIRKYILLLCQQKLETPQSEKEGTSARRST